VPYVGTLLLCEEGTYFASLLHENILIDVVKKRVTRSMNHYTNMGIARNDIYI